MLGTTPETAKQALKKSLHPSAGNRRLRTAKSKSARISDAPEALCDG